VLKTFPVGGACPGLALIDIDHDDLLVGPAQRDRAGAQIVLAVRALGVVDDLLRVDWRTYRSTGLARCAAVTLDAAVSVNTGIDSSPSEQGSHATDFDDG
jgi:hypothetical protein